MNLWIDSWNSVSSSRSTYIFNARISGASAKRPSARAVPFTFPSRSQGPSGQSRRCSLSSIRQPQKDASCCSRLCSPESPWHPWSVVTFLGAVFRMPVEAGPRPRGNCLLPRHARSEGDSRRVISWEAGSVVTGAGASCSGVLLALPSGSQEGSGGSQHVASHLPHQRPRGGGAIPVPLPPLRRKNASEASSCVVDTCRPGHVPHAKATWPAGEAQGPRLTEVGCGQHGPQLSCVVQGNFKAARASAG